MSYWDKHHVIRRETLFLINNSQIIIKNLPVCFGFSKRLNEYFCKGNVLKKSKGKSVFDHVCIGCGFRC